VSKLNEQKEIIEQYGHDEVLLKEKLGIVHDLRHVGNYHARANSQAPENLKEAEESMNRIKVI
jgi:hypothetical protein